MFVADEMLPHDKVIRLELRKKFTKPVVAFGIILHLKAKQNLDIVLIFLFQRQNAFGIILSKLWLHPEKAVVAVLFEELRRVVGKAENLDPRFYRGLNVIAILADRVVASVCMRVKIILHLYHLSGFHKAALPFFESAARLLITVNLPGQQFFTLFRKVPFRRRSRRHTDARISDFY